MNDRIRVAHNDCGCWQVFRGESVLAIFPKHMWLLAYTEACRVAALDNLSIISLEICS